MHYGGYTLAQAMDLSENELELLTAVRVADEIRQREWLEDALGVSMNMAPAPKQKGPVTRSAVIRVPLGAMLAPDFVAAVQDKYKKGAAETVADNPDHVQVANLGKDEAKPMIKQMMAIAAAAEAVRTQEE